MQELFAMNKPTLQAVHQESQTNTPAPNPFDPANLRLDQSYTETVGVNKLITTIPVRRPNKQTFFRVHPGGEWRDNFPIIDLKDDREEYIVAKPLVPELFTEIVYKQLRLGITRQGNLFFLPLPLPGPDGKDNPWWSSLRELADRAETNWIRVISNKELGAYEALQASDALSEPAWDLQGLKFWDLIEIAFKKFLITDIEHPVVKRLRGRV
jgi:hypothetical protein